MAKKRSEILSFDVSTDKFYKLADSILSEPEDKLISDYTISYLPATEIKYSLINAGEDDDDEQIGNKAYEELDLDIEKDYQIRYALVEGLGQSSTHAYNVLAVESQVLERQFKSVLAKTDYIDYIDFEPMLYSAYYSSNTFSAQGAHFYIYIHKSYATLTLYKDGELCAFRCVNKLSLDALHAAYCHELGERVAEHTFLEEFRLFGFDHTDGSRRVALNKVFAESCMFLINNISFLLRSLKLENEPVNMLALGMDMGNVKNTLNKLKVLCANFKNADADMLLEAMLENQQAQTDVSLAVNSFTDLASLKCDLFKNAKSFVNEEGYSLLTPLGVLLFMRAVEQMRDGEGIFNASIFLRPPPLFKRPSGKIIASVVIALLATGAYPCFNYAQGYITAMQKESIEAKIPDMQREYNKLKSSIESLQAQIKAADDVVSEKEDRLRIRTGLLNALYDKKVNYTQKAKIFVDATKLMNDAGVKVEFMELEKNTLKLRLVGTNIAVSEFVKNLGANRAYEIRSNEVNISQGAAEFVTDIEVKVRR